MQGSRNIYERQANAGVDNIIDSKSRKVDKIARLLSYIKQQHSK
jgi:DNA repair photolyase